MKFDKNEKSGVEKQRSKKKTTIFIVIGVVALILFLVPIIMGGLK